MLTFCFCVLTYLIRMYFFPDLHFSLNYEIPVEGGIRKETLGLKGKICVAGEM